LSENNFSKVAFGSRASRFYLQLLILNQSNEQLVDLSAEKFKILRLATFFSYSGFFFRNFNFRLSLFIVDPQFHARASFAVDFCCHVPPSE
jgi:hypothetical protein